MRSLLMACVMSLGIMTLTTDIAPAAFLNTVDRGWYRDDGSHLTANTNYIVGVISFGSGVTLNNFFVFDLSVVTGPIIAANLVLYNPSVSDRSGQGYFSPNSFETITLYDVTTSIPSLTAGTGGTSAFTDLGSGTTYGSGTASAADNGQFVTITLNSAGLAALNANLGGQFAIGGSLGITSTSVDRVVFSGSNLSTNPADGQTYLDYTTAPPTNVVPAPPGLLMVLTGLPVLGLVRRFRRTVAAA